MNPLYHEWTTNDVKKTWKENEKETSFWGGKHVIITRNKQKDTIYITGNTLFALCYSLWNWRCKKVWVIGKTEENVIKKLGPDHKMLELLKQKNLIKRKEMLFDRIYHLFEDLESSHSVEQKKYLLQRIQLQVSIFNETGTKIGQELLRKNITPEEALEIYRKYKNY